MVFTLDEVIPWGRSFEEYVAMFALSEGDLQSRILGCADGPASFNVEMHRRGQRVISVDPLYQHSLEQIRQRINSASAKVSEQLRENQDDYVWNTIPSIGALRELRMKTMRGFLVDFDQGKKEGRYLAYRLPRLPFQDEEFDLALCSHFLFLYSDQLSADFHCRAIQEMRRVAREARIFPLFTLGRQPSPHLGKVYEHLRRLDRDFEVRSVTYEFYRGGNKMLRVW